MAAPGGSIFKESLVELMKDMGYPITGSVCFGFTVMLLQAFLLNPKQIHAFTEHLYMAPTLMREHLSTMQQTLTQLHQLIEQKASAQEIEKKTSEIQTASLKTIFLNKQKGLVQEFATAKEKKLVAPKLSPPSQSFLDSWAWLDGITLQQSPYALKNILPQIEIKSNSLSSALPLTQSIALDKIAREAKATTAIIQVAELSRVYNAEQLAKSLNNLYPLTNAPIVLTFSSLNHTTALCFDPKEQQWIFGDLENLPLKFFAVTSTLPLATEIIAGFSSNKYAAFTTQVYCLINDEETIKPAIAKWQALYQFERYNSMNVLHAREQKFINEQAKISDSVNGTWLYLAARDGNTNLARRLLTKGADPQLLSKQPRTPLAIAAANGHKVIVTMLLDKAKALKIKINQDQLNSALFGCVQNGYTDVVTLFLDPKNNYLFPPKQVALALGSAAESGRLEIAKIILHYLALKPIDPAYLLFALEKSAANGHENIVNLLLTVKNKEGVPLIMFLPEGINSALEAAKKHHHPNITAILSRLHTELKPEPQSSYATSIATAILCADSKPTAVAAAASYLAPKVDATLSYK